MLNLVLLYQGLELRRVVVWLISGWECVLMVSYVLLLDHRSEQVRISSSRLVVVVIGVIVVHGTKLKWLLAGLVAKINIVKVLTDLYIFTKDLRVVSLFWGANIKRWVMEVAKEVGGRVMVRVIVRLIQVFTCVLINLVNSSWRLGPVFLVLIHLELKILLIERVADQLPEVSSHWARVVMLDVLREDCFGQNLLRLLAVWQGLLHLLVGLADLLAKEFRFLLAWGVDLVTCACGGLVAGGVLRGQGPDALTFLGKGLEGLCPWEVAPTIQTLRAFILFAWVELSNWNDAILLLTGVHLIPPIIRIWKGWD